MRICFASHNKDKVKELNGIIGKFHDIYGLKELGMEENIPETGSTFEENSQIKAQYIFEKYKVPVLADDSGLSVKSLNGEPGVFSSRYASNHKDDNANIDLLLKKLGENKERKAEFKTVITFINKDGSQHQFAESIEGIITKEKQGENGFGYDPIFQPKNHNRTFAELSFEKKNKISHRAKAVKKLMEYLHQIQ